MKKISAHLFASCLALLTFAAHAESFGDWADKKKIVIDTTADSGMDLKDGTAQVPVAIRLHTGNFEFGKAKPDGSDIRVAGSDGKTPLRFHVEKFDAQNELGVVWVQLPKLAPNAKADSITLFSGNDKAAAAGDAKGTFDTVQTLVLHFDDKAGAIQDATGNNQPSESGAKLGAIGPLGAAASFDGAGKVVLPGSGNLKFIASSGLTFTAWVKPTDVSTGTLFEQGALSIGLSGGSLVASVGGKELKSSSPVKANEWQQVAVSFGGGKVNFYIDGLPVGSADVAPVDSGADVVIGGRYRGDMDEVTLASAARSPAYIAALFGGQQPDSLLLSFESEEGGGGETNYLAILLGALTVDGWVVIGILAVMGIVSFAVMVGKARFLVLAQKSNNSFLDRFRKESEEFLMVDSATPAQLQQIEMMRHSSIYRLYSVGMAEMQQRFDAMKKREQPMVLSDASLNAIRASIDAVQVRENHRLNSQIVLLTIAISGGPFLGLLGTVVGVMITFAAIAAAGDVNVNAIAPGIAAALVATVAGLAVAIPALFGYNWLSSQIKNVSADMQIFADEFVTRAAELHTR